MSASGTWDRDEIYFHFLLSDYEAQFIESHVFIHVHCSASWLIISIKQVFIYILMIQDFLYTTL